MAVGEATTAAASGAAAVNHEKEWAYPAEKDGWYRTHTVIRQDMAVFLEAITSLQARLKGGASLHAWEVEYLQQWWDNFYHNVHMHHDHEEELFFPELNKRFTLPPKMTSDHKALMQAMDECREIIRSVNATEPSDKSLEKVTSLITKFPAFQTSMDEHLKEEEEVGLPLYRQHFSPKEGKALVDKILKQMKPMDVGWLLHNWTKEEAREFFKQEGAPKPVAELILIPSGPKFNKKYTVLIEAVKSGKEPVKPKKLFSCFG